MNNNWKSIVTLDYMSGGNFQAPFWKAKEMVRPNVDTNGLQGAMVFTLVTVLYTRNFQFEMHEQ